VKIATSYPVITPLEQSVTPVTGLDSATSAAVLANRHLLTLDDPNTATGFLVSPWRQRSSGHSRSAPNSHTGPRRLPIRGRGIARDGQALVRMPRGKLTLGRSSDANRLTRRLTRS